MTQRHNGRANHTLRSTVTKVTLAASDLLLFNAAPWVAIAAVYLLWGNVSSYIPPDEVASRLSAHFLLSLVCTMWFWGRLRHYTYRKPFWFELKEVLRTVIVFAV